MAAFQSEEVSLARSEAAFADVSRKTRPTGVVVRYYGTDVFAVDRNLRGSTVVEQPLIVANY
jgi:hypothetical protein